MLAGQLSSLEGDPLSQYPVIFVGARVVVHGIILCQKLQGQCPLVRWYFCSLSASVRLGSAGHQGSVINLPRQM